MPNPSGIYDEDLITMTTESNLPLLTILNHIWNQFESGLNRDMEIAAMKGKIPKIMLRALYFPVRCIIHLEG